MNNFGFESISVEEQQSVIEHAFNKLENKMEEMQKNEEIAGTFYVGEIPVMD